MHYNDSFERHFTKMRNIILGCIALIFSAIIALYVVIGMGVYTVISNPDNISRGAGRIMGEFIRGMEETRHAP